MVQELVVKKSNFFGQEMKIYEEAYSNLNELLEKSVEAFSGKEMLVIGEKRVTYEEFYGMVLDMAANLQQKYDFKQGEKLAILANNTLEFCISLFATSYLGGIIVPLNTRLQAKELSYMLQDSETKLIVVEDVLLENLPKAITNDRLDVEIIEFSIDPDKSGKSAFQELLKPAPPVKKCEVKQTDPLFIMYTSGTTGTPKGAVGTHLGITQNVVNFKRNLGTKENERCLISVPLFHVTGLIASLNHMIYVGGTSVIMYQFKTNKFLELMDAERITYVNTVPTIFIFLLNHPNRASYDLSHLRLAVTGGSPMAVSTIKQLLALYPHLNFVNNYGATECTGSCTFSKAEKAIEKADSVGILTDIIDWKIVGEDGSEVPKYKAGELWIKGPTVIPKYWNNAVANNTEFVDGFWKSGDVGYVDDENYFYLLDRKKNMINRGGENIYPSEIENTLYEHPKVLEVAVIGVPDDVFGEEVMALVVSKKGETLSAEDIKLFLSDKLADYKIPKFIDFTDELPRNMSGKILKFQIQQKYYSK